MINCITQQAAKFKLCCGPEGCGDIIKPADDVPLRICIASGCMAWRWQTAIFNLKTQKWMQPTDKLEPDGFETRVTDVGYCGLAGVPAP